MNKALLLPFYGNDKTRWILNAPITLSGHTLATDARLIVAVIDKESADSAIEKHLAESFTKIISDIYNTIAYGKKGEIPSAIPAASFNTCATCQGHGRFEKCTNCGGEGEKECGECGHTSECDACDASGTVPSASGDITCEECDGVGKQEVFTFSQINAIKFNNRYLRKIHEHLLVSEFFTNGRSLAAFTGKFRDDQSTLFIGGLMPVFNL